MFDVKVKVDDIDYEKSFCSLFPQLYTICSNAKTDHLLVRFLNKMGDASIPVIVGILRLLTEKCKGELLCDLINSFDMECVDALNSLLIQDKLGQCFQCSGISMKQDDSTAVSITLTGVVVKYDMLLQNDFIREKIVDHICNTMGGFFGNDLVEKFAERGTNYVTSLVNTMPNVSEKIILSILEQEKARRTLLCLAEKELNESGICFSLGDVSIQQSNSPEQTHNASEHGMIKLSWQLEEALLDSISTYLKSTVNGYGSSM